MHHASSRPALLLPATLPAPRRGTRLLLRGTLAGLLLALAACKPVTPEHGNATADAAPIAHGAADPVQAVTVTSALLRGNDYAGFARAAVPADLHAALDAAWRSGHSRWPLSELPFEQRLPALLQALSAPGAETALQRAFDRQFAGADRELHQAAEALGVFGTEYLRTGEGFSDAERAHYTQLVRAAAVWARTAPLGDKRLAHVAVVRMVAAARGSGLGDAGSFAAHGMDEGLRRIGPFLAATKDTLRDYGLDLDASLQAMQVELIDSQGDVASVRMHYPLGQQQIQAQVQVLRLDGRWYLQDFIDHARQAVAAAQEGGDRDPDPDPTEVLPGHVLPQPEPAPREGAAPPGNRPPPPQAGTGQPARRQHPPGTASA